jgi:hypothetical protein
MVNTIEVNLCLCLDLFTFQRAVGDLAGVRTFFHVFREYPHLSRFVDKMCVRHPRIQLAVAEAMAACGEAINVRSVVLPVVESEPQGMDLQGLLNQAVQKLKWQKNSATVVAECAGLILRAILAEAPPVFDVPVSRNEAVRMMIRAKNAAICSSVCSKNNGILKLTIYELVAGGEIEFLKSVLPLLFESTAAATVLSALSKSLVLKPEFTESMAPVVSEIPPSVDPSPFIRFMSHNCTLDEIAVLTNNVVFPSVPSQVIQLFRDSLKWKSIVQSSFWLIVKRAYICERYTAVILSAFQGLIKPLSEGQVSSFQMRQLLRKTAPSSAVAPLVEEMATGSETQQVILVAMLVSWSDFFSVETEKFVRNRASIFRAFYEGLSPTSKSRFPTAISDILPSPT